MKINQQRFEEAQRYDRYFYEEIYNRFPSVMNITTMEGTKDNNGQCGVRDVLTLNDYMHNTDAIAISDDKDIMRFQFKTTKTNTVWFDIIETRFDRFKSIKGSYANGNSVYYLTCGDADIIAFYMINSSKMYFFDITVVRNIFRYEDAWLQGSIEKSNNGCTLIRIDIDKFMYIYKKYSDFLLGGGPEESESEGHKDGYPDDSREI